MINSDFFNSLTAVRELIHTIKLQQLLEKLKLETHGKTEYRKTGI